jgi:hypothetical protein
MALSKERIAEADEIEAQIARVLRGLQDKKPNG